MDDCLKCKCGRKLDKDERVCPNCIDRRDRRLKKSIITVAMLAPLLIVKVLRAVTKTRRNS